MPSSYLRFVAVAALLWSVFTSSPLRAQIPIPAFPVQGIEYKPLPAVFIMAARGTVQESSIEIINHKPEALEIKEVENPSKRFTARVETVEPGRHYRLTVTLKGEGPAGKQRQDV
jgi:hypothetical protein